MKNCFPDAKQIKNIKKKLRKECTHVQQEINEIDENFYSKNNNELTFSPSFFMKNM